MKKLLMIAPVLLLSGCFYQTVNNVDIERAIYACKGAQNIATVTIVLDGGEWVLCKDSEKQVHLESVIIPNTNDKAIQNH